MVVHCKVEVLVMLCQLIEGGRQKCHRYWPDKDIDPDGNRNYGNMIDVKHLDTVQRPDYQVRTFTITCEGTSRKVTQFSFKAWPDHGCPASTAALLGFTSAVRRAVTTPEVPIVVHCSAGIGQTGTYMGMDICTYGLFLERSLNGRMRVGSPHQIEHAYLLFAVLSCTANKVCTDRVALDGVVFANSLCIYLQMWF